MESNRKTQDERKAALALQVSQRVASGMRVESQSDFQAVLVKGKPVNHILHGILTFFSMGMWGIVWLILFLTGGQTREIVGADRWCESIRRASTRRRSNSYRPCSIRRTMPSWRNGTNTGARTVAVRSTTRRLCIPKTGVRSATPPLGSSDPLAKIPYNSHVKHSATPDERTRPDSSFRPTHGQLPL